VRRSTRLKKKQDKKLTKNSETQTLALPLQ
jgi:hypothetical protein